MRRAVFIGLGSNMGDKKANLRRALKEIEERSLGMVTGRSSLYLTEPVGVKDQEDFINAAAVIETDSDLRDLIHNAMPDPTHRIITGLIICIAFTFLPFAVSLKFKQQHITINIPNILYVITFLTGVVICYIIGFFGIDILFFLCFIIISIIASYYWFGKSKGIASEE